MRGARVWVRGSRAVGRVVVPLAVSICQRGWMRKASMQRRMRKWAKAIVRRMKRINRAWKAVGMVAERARARSGGVAVSVSVSESVSESMA